MSDSLNSSADSGKPSDLSDGSEGFWYNIFSTKFSDNEAQSLSQKFHQNELKVQHLQQLNAADLKSECQITLGKAAEILELFKSKGLILDESKLQQQQIQQLQQQLQSKDQEYHELQRVTKQLERVTKQKDEELERVTKRHKAEVEKVIDNGMERLLRPLKITRQCSPSHLSKQLFPPPPSQHSKPMRT